MSTRLSRVALPSAALIALTGAALAGPAVSTAAECGPGTVYDPATNQCVVAPPAAPAAWNAPPPPPPLPPVSICPPIPFVAVCFPVN